MSADPSRTYHWVLQPRRGAAVAGLARTLLLVLVVPAITYGLLVAAAWVIRRFVRLPALHVPVLDAPVPEALLPAFPAIALVGVLGLLRLSLPLLPVRWRAGRLVQPVYLALLGCLAFLLQTVGGLSPGAAVPSLEQLAPFFAEQVMRVALFDYVEIFGVHLSPLEPSGEYGRLLLVAFNTLITVGLVEAILKAIGASKTRRFYGTPGELRLHLLRQPDRPAALDVTRAAVFVPPRRLEHYDIEQIEQLGDALDDLDAVHTKQWRIHSPGGSLLWGVVQGMALGFLGPLGVFGVLWALGLLLPTIALWTAVFALGVLGLAWVVHAFAFAFRSEARLQAERFDIDELYFLNLMLLGLLAYVLYSPLSPLAEGFAHRAASAVEWLRFYADAVMRVVLLDVVEFLELDISAMQPTTWPARLAMLVVNVLVTAGVVEAFVSSIRAVRSSDTYVGTTRQVVDKYAVAMNVADDTVVEAEALLRPLDEPPVRASELLPTLPEDG